MSTSPIVTGARALLGVYDANSGKVRIVGIYNNVSYGLSYSAEEAHILGRYSPAAITYTAQNVVNISASGYRVLDHGPHIDGGLPRLQDLIDFEYLEMTIIDRQRENQGAPSQVAKFTGVVPTGYSTTINARNQQELSQTFMAITVSDESVDNAEGPGAADLP